jgi:vesicular inhibitory amino acid transporter
MVLLGDSLNALFPSISSDMWKIIGLVVILPTTFLPLWFLSFPSVLSTFCTVLLIGIVVFDGLWKTDAPGSILDPMPTHLGPELEGANWLGGVGLVLAGFGGHAVIPSIARDMKHPESASRVFNIAFTIAGAIAFAAGATGYLMFGDEVSDQITRDLKNPLFGYPKILNTFAVWMIVSAPVSKFGLCS